MSLTNLGLEIRSKPTLKPHDLTALSDVYESVNMRARNPDLLAQALAQSSYYCAAYRNDTICGFGRLITDGTWYATLVDVAVLPSHQRQGIGTALVNKLIRYCDEQGFHMISLLTTGKNRSWYEGLGFVWQDDINAMIRTRT